MNTPKQKISSSTPFLLTIIIVIAIAAFWYRSSSKKTGEEISAETKPKKARPTKSIEKTDARPELTTENPPSENSSQKKSAPLTGIQVSAAPKGKNRQIPKDHVEFELMNNNIAVAFGDVILGRLQNDIKTPRGLFKPPKSKLWPSNIIPFGVRDGTPNPDNIKEALKYFSENTPVQFVPATPNDKLGVIFEPWDETKCASYVGTIGDLQPIFIGPNCGTQEILHEVMHALGFVHEQSRVDRDKYVRILWENIIEEFTNQFDMVPDSMIHPYVGSVFNFDYESVMLYRAESFAKSAGLKTMEALNNNIIAPMNHGLSRRDLERLHYLYGN